jgi:recombinational DNA repair protein RecR
MTDTCEKHCEATAFKIVIRGLEVEVARLKKALAQPEQERNFCSRCGKRTKDLTHIHTCTPPKENT